jgi:hypothetical protein
MYLLAYRISSILRLKFEVVEVDRFEANVDSVELSKPGSFLTVKTYCQNKLGKDTTKVMVFKVKDID